MSKLKKRIVALGMAFVMTIAMIPMLASLALADETPATIKVYLTVSNQGELAEANDHSIMAWKEVEVTDLDGEQPFTYDEAMVAAHAAYNSSEGYVTSGGQVKKLWGVDSTNNLFFINGKGLSTGVTADIIHDGDVLFASVNQDNTFWSDWYTAFDKPSVEASSGDDVTLTLTGYQGMMSYMNPDMTPVAGVTVKTVEGTVLGITNEEGEITFTAPAAGKYIITAEGSVNDVVTDWTLQSNEDLYGTDAYVKPDEDMDSSFAIGYTEKNYGEGPYPIDEVIWIDWIDWFGDDEFEGNLLYSNQFYTDCPIMAPAANLTVTEATSELADGTYNANGLSTAVLSMYHFHDAQVVVKGDEAWLITTEDTDNTVKRFDGMAYGPQSEILDPADETNHTLVEGTPTAKVVPIYKEDGTLETRTFVLPVPKSIFENGQDIYYMVKYVAGYSDSHDGDWYKASGGDYYLTGYTLEKISDSTDLPGEEDSEPIELAITNNTGMFKAETATAVENADGSATLTFALSGSGYHYLYKGTYEQAVANGAATENWIAGAVNADGKWEFQMTVNADELGKDIPVVAISQSYYEKYLNGQNSLERAFYPRQLNLDLEEATLVTGDYEVTKEIVVTNNISMFRPAAKATLHVVGGPNSNNYAATLTLPMTTDSLSEAFVGYPDEAEAAAQTIAFDETSMTFTIPVKWVETFGDPTTTVNLCNGEPFTLSTKSASNGKWYGRTATLDEEAGTLVFDPFVDPRPANTVDELIAKIQSQVFTDTTWTDCEAAKAAWDALSDAEKALVEEYDYFGLDTGDASADDPLNQDEIGKKEILVVSFGTSFNDSRVATIGGVEKAIADAYPDWSVRRAFTAQIIINHIYARDGEKIDNVQQALDRAVANDVETLVVQPTHLMHGAEYDELVEALAPYQDEMTIIISEPLLGEVGEDATVINDDKLAVAEAIVAAACEDAEYAGAAAAAADGTAIVLMGHGTAHVASVTYEQMQTAMNQLGYDNVFVGTVEGEPESTECSNVIAAVKAAGYTKVILRPLMVVAGDHANNDMADPEDEESWLSQFTADGSFVSVDCQIAGLGQIEAVQQIYVAHLADVIPEEPIVITKQPEDVTIQLGKEANFSIEAEGEDLTYTWYYKLDGKTVFRVWKGHTDASITSYKPTEDKNGMQVYCIVSDSAGKTVMSDTVTLTFLENPIKQHPSDVSIVAGNSATFSISAVGEGLTYQWYYKLAGKTTFRVWKDHTEASFNYAPAADKNGMEVLCIVTDGAGNEWTSEIATLTITENDEEAITIVTQPSNASISLGDSVSFNIEAEGENLTYQWYYKLDGKTTFRVWKEHAEASFHYVPKADKNGMQVYCVVEDGAGNTKTSETVTLTIN